MFSLDSYFLKFIGFILSVVLFVFILPTFRSRVSEKNQQALSDTNQLMQEYWTTTTIKPSNRTVEEINSLGKLRKFIIS